MPPIPFGLWCGIVVAELILSGAWGLFGPGPEVPRAAWSAAWAAILGFMVGLPFAFQARALDEVFSPLMTAVLALLPWFVTVGFLHAVQQFFKLWLLESGELPKVPSARAIQFSIRGLLILTAMIAALLAGGRFIAFTFHNVRFLRGLGELLLPPFCLLSLTVLQIMALLYPGPIVLRWLLVLVYLGLATLCEAVVWSPIFRWTEESLTFSLAFNGAMHVVLALNLLLLRSAGFRLVRAQKGMAQR